MAVGEVEHLELGVEDGDKAQSFFSALLGWSFDDMGGGNGRTTSGAPVGVHPGDAGGGFEVYFTVADLDASLEKLKELGGSSGKINEAAEFGRYSRCTDDQGTAFGLRQLPA